MTTSVGLVHVGPDLLEPREFPIPEIGDDDGLLRIERCGLCGSDIEQVRGRLSFVPTQVIPGHEPVGIVERVGARAAQRWGVQEGDRVIVAAAIPCRRCRVCAAGRYDACPTRLSLGFVPVSVEPALYGGFADHLYLAPNATLFRMSHDVPIDLAPFYNALSCGVGWVADESPVELGSTVLVLGSGQRGIACGIVAKAIGAGLVVMTGLHRDAHKLAIARQMGIDVTIDIEHEDLRGRIDELTGGEGVDVVIDTVPNVPSTITDAIAVVAPRGTICVAGIKGGQPVPEFVADTLVHKAVTLKGVLSKRSRSTERAIRMLEADPAAFAPLAPRSYPLADALDALEDLAGTGPLPGAVCVSLDPNASA